MGRFRQCIWKSFYYVLDKPSPHVCSMVNVVFKNIHVNFFPNKSKISYFFQICIVTFNEVSPNSISISPENCIAKKLIRTYGLYILIFLLIRFCPKNKSENKLLCDIFDLKYVNEH